MIGAMIGCTLIFLTVQNASRRILMFFVDFCYVTGAALSMTENYYIFLFARIFSGLALGSDSILTPLFL
jgi:predicted MFS family arabinose efflux permease